MRKDDNPDQPFLDFAWAGDGDGQPFFASARAQRNAKQERLASIGDAVHYQADECWAAIVTAVDPFSDAVAVTAFPAGAVVVRPMAGVEHDEGKKAGTWHWGHE